MVEYTCECCSFSTTKKSTYKDHIGSVKHKKNFQTDSSSVISNITEPDTTFSETKSILQIKDLENEIKLKELELQNIKTFYEAQLKNKDEIITLLKQQINQPTIQPTIQQIIQPQPITENKSKTHLSPKQIIENLTNTRKEAMSIHEFLENEFYGEKNSKYFISVKEKNLTTSKEKHYFNKATQEYIIPKTFNGLFDCSCIGKLIVNIFCNIIDNTEKHLCPLFVNDKKRCIFYVKMEDTWKRMTDEEFDIVLIKIIKFVERDINFAEQNLRFIFENNNNFYNKIYPNGIKNPEVYQSMRSPIKVILIKEFTDEFLQIIIKHLKSKLSEITTEKQIKFKTIKDNYKPAEEDEESVYDDSTQDDEY
jgi:hypothetical protein